MDSLSVSELKSEIIRVAKENTNRLDNFSEVRSKLTPLANRLAELGAQTVDERTEGKIEAGTTMD